MPLRVNPIHRLPFSIKSIASTVQPCTCEGMRGRKHHISCLQPSRMQAILQLMLLEMQKKAGLLLQKQLYAPSAIGRHETESIKHWHS